MLAAVGKRNVNFVCVFDYVHVRNDIAALVDDGAGARAAVLRDRFQKPVDRHNLRVYVYDGFVAAVVNGNILHFVLRVR